MPKLSPGTIDRIEILFASECREPAKGMIRSLNPIEGDRLQFAALKFSDGDLHKLEAAVRLGNQDFRDLLMAVGFGEPDAHKRWRPKPAGEPALVNPVALAEAIHERLGAILVPLRFHREADEWIRVQDYRQSLRLVTGLTSRIQTRFFLHLKLEASPTPIVLHLPLMRSFMSQEEQGYIFRAGESEGSVFGAIRAEVDAEILTLLERLSSNEQARLALADGSLKPFMPVRGEAWLVRRRR